METTNKVLVSLLGVLLVLLALFGAYALGDNKPVQVINSTNTITLKEVVIDNATAAKVDALSNKIASLDEFDRKSDEQAQNDTAKSLVLAEMAKKDFKRDLLDLLNENFSIESYKNLTISDIKIEDIDLDDDTATVLVSYKVTFDNFGDNDYTKKASVETEFLVSDLVVDDAFEDAEVSYETEDIKILRVKDLD